jgi:nitrate/TMAO reductase-like tetraheme cytochrome c subunit
MHKRLLAAAVLITVASIPAGADEAFPPIANTTVKTECSACHMLFQPQMLPKRSWQAIVDGLAKHFGEDASLPPAKATEVLTYLVANAADARGAGNKFLTGLTATATPLRIAETPYWLRKHRKVQPEVWKRASVGGKANCKACHQGADKGDYDDDGVRIPK